MHLSELTIENLRACQQTGVRLRPDVTVLTGRNDSGKTTVLDALRQLTDPLDGHRGPGLTEVDVSHDSTPTGRIRLHAVLAGIQPEHAGTYRDALLPGAGEAGTRRARWSVTYTPPPPGRRRGLTTWHVGEGRETAGEPSLRSAIRHIHLPAGRDAGRDLTGPAGTARIRVLLEALLAAPDENNAFLDRAAFSLMDLSADPAVRAVSAAVSRPMAAITAAAERRQAGLTAVDSTLSELSRVLRMTSWISGTNAAGALRTGQGYAYALYLATVLAELEAARESDLTLLLIDGPEAHLHPLLSGVLLKHLQEAAQASRRRDQQDPALPAGHVQVVVSTHAPGLSAAVSARDLVVLNRQGQQPVRAVAVGDLEIGSRELRRLDRYLSVSKSSLLYGAPVLLVATTVEALLLSALADLVLTGQDREQTGHDASRFRAATVIAASDVDPGLVLTVLIDESGKARFGHRIAVFTGPSPGASGATPPTASTVQLSDVPRAGTDSVRRFAVGEPIWQTLMCPANEAVLRTALLEAEADGAQRWQAVEAEVPAERPRIFQNLFSPGLGGEPAVCPIRYVHALADLLADGSSFTVPAPIADTIRFLAHTDADPDAEAP